MQNEEGEIMDLYIPRKCSATNRLITAKDHASVQINIGHLDERGVYTGSFTTFALSGFVRAQVGMLTVLLIASGKRRKLNSVSNKMMVVPRNKYPFEEGFRIDVNAWTNALKFVSDFRKMAESTVDSGAIVRGGWNCPQPGCWKINFDGAKLGDWGHGWGMVVRDTEGDVALAAVQQGPEFLGPEMEEARAC
ncbi:hypothetical protein Cgig2_023018 [Carnegiea gigantea]|uniref:40S ribosomal protein S21 n=1 Tax=Carnegiea gigantea TaxID=171969 RepID=A0A9Q1QEQ7_9CARY|nr:hypothetical protein Cgig2_023018 [Carnegiea gigantea]